MAKVLEMFREAFVKGDITVEQMNQGMCKVLGVMDYLSLSKEDEKMSALHFGGDTCVEVRPCPYGRGVFATRDIKMGEVITYYPAHHLSVGGSSTISFVENKPDDDYLYSSLDGRRIWGDSEKTDNRYMLGHMINDACDNVFRREGDTMGEWFGRYILYTRQRRNARFGEREEDDGIVSVYATRDIKKDEEIFISYGLQYWGIRNGFIKKGDNVLSSFLRLRDELGEKKSHFLSRIVLEDKLF
jgi:hypothetical protein